MPGKIERSIDELYREDPERADAIAFGRRTGMSRRGFLGGSGLAAMGLAVGGAIPFAESMPGGLVPAAMAQATGSPPAAPKGPQYLNFPGKSDKLVVLGERPLVAETPEHLLDDDTTPTDKFFVRNNGMIPDAAKDPEAWKITVDGEVNQKLELTLAELKTQIQAGDPAPGAGMRRQRPLVLFPAGARQPVGQWRRRLRRMDRRAARRRAQGRGRQAVRRVHRPLRRRPQPRRRQQGCASRAACRSRRRWTSTTSSSSP